MIKAQRAGNGIGDLSTLYHFERKVQQSGVPVAINRGAYYFTNLNVLVEPAAKGSLPTPFPANLKLPMVAPADLGKVAAERLLSPVDDTGIEYVEGPERYNFNDVAKTISKHLGHEVRVATTPRDQWEQSFKALGFSPKAAKAYARMTGATVDDPELPDHPRRGRTSLEQYLQSILS